MNPEIAFALVAHKAWAEGFIVGLGSGFAAAIGTMVVATIASIIRGRI